jgi:hypothetical protein
MRITKGRGRAAASLLIACAAAALVSSCGEMDKPSEAVKRQQLFALSYGPAEDQLDLFQVDQGQATLKTRLAMREGIFYVSNGQGAKVVRYSSFGDVLSMIYNSAKASSPIVLKASPQRGSAAAKPGALPGTATQLSTSPGSAADSEGLGREAVTYPFRVPGEIAVDAAQVVYVEDRLPPERRVEDKDSGSLLDRVVLRFGKDGQYIDYLGQEGIGGTPFPYISGLYIASGDDCAVVCMKRDEWLIYWFDKTGTLVSSLRLRRDGLPMPDDAKGLVASLDKIVPDSSGRDLVVKIDYYRTASDPSGKSTSGVEFASSWAYKMDVKDGKYTERWPIKGIERTGKNANGQIAKYSRIPQLIGAAGKYLFLLYADDDLKTYVALYDRSTRDMARYLLDVSSDELYYCDYYLSADGVLCALLGTRYEARMVWWRFDKSIGGAKPALVK